MQRRSQLKHFSSLWPTSQRSLIEHGGMKLILEMLEKVYATPEMRIPQAVHAVLHGEGGGGRSPCPNPLISKATRSEGHLTGRQRLHWGDCEALQARSRAAGLLWSFPGYV